ncbi:FitA-like ribbon-helix-helix domain-containing protein [Aureimonas phyllosphaerae]|uniref:Plasmid stability protein n=1 Tax=Aureimonas phyllosphaerae TaxID=1166078 RepID=A0A7W6BYJ5_9HYPH|nr:hypothetical protein [Aureimonas phyllosphaerae]MBB3937513.1 plasmid stability protein [Aureimonas phyllosphaerae]MBB3961421.1 plasmid stability protein [Aureimonas phyllosphaerae]SFF37963.1 hypothetical protein SAMN05216566_11026 [Aureimonas phyllosphaerae]
MASLTIRNIDDDLKRKLQIRAARNGRSMEQDLRLALQNLVAEERKPRLRSEAEARVIYEQLRALRQPPLEPIDQKAVSDELYDYLP